MIYKAYTLSMMAEMSAEQYGNKTSMALADAPKASSLDQTPQLQTTKSQSIPIINHIRRTKSEKSLLEDEAIADYRDYCMYQRIVTGITRRREDEDRSDVRSLDYLYETDACIQNINRSRHQHPDHVESLYSRDQKVSGALLATKKENVSPLAHDILTHYNNSFLAPTMHNLDEDDDQVFALDL